MSVVSTKHHRNEYHEKPFKAKAVDGILAAPTIDGKLVYERRGANYLLVYLSSVMADPVPAASRRHMHTCSLR